MNIICINEFGDFDILQTRTIYIGDSELTGMKQGMLQEDIFAILEAAGYKKVEPKSLEFSDDYITAKTKDKRLRLINNNWFRMEVL